jgi:hypothetical protein
MTLKEKVAILMAMQVATTKDGEELDKEINAVIKAGVGKIYNFNYSDNPKLGDLLGTLYAATDLTQETIKVMQRLIVEIEEETAE